MDRSHTIVRMRQSALKLAIPTEVFDNLVRQAEEQALDDERSGRIFFSQRQARVEALVWNNIWPNHPFPFPHGPVLRRSLRYNNQQMNYSVQNPAESLASRSHPRMGAYRYLPTSNQTHFLSNTTQFEFPPSYPHTTQQCTYEERSNHFTFSDHPTALFPLPGLPCNPVHDGGSFHPSTRLQSQFASQPLLQPIGTGRPSSSTNYEGYHPVQAAGRVSNRNRELEPFETYTSPFSKALTDPHRQHFVQPQQSANITNNAHPRDWLLQRPISVTYSEPRSDVPALRALRKSIHQLPILNPSRPQTRGGSIPSRRDFQAESRETCNKPGDITLSHGIFKKRRNPVPRKAAVAACAAIAGAAKMDMDSESIEVRMKSPKRTWAQVVSSSIKEEENEETLALQGPPRTSSGPIKQENVHEGDRKTWAKVAAGAWKETNQTQQNMRAGSFGNHQLSGSFIHDRLFKNAKFNTEHMTINIAQNPKGAFNHSLFSMRHKRIPAHVESQKGRVSARQFPKVAKDVKNWNTGRGSIGGARKNGNGKN